MKFDFEKDFTLENDAVLLRPIESSDVKSLLHFSENEPELWTYSLVSAASKSNLEKYIDLALEGRRSQHAYPFIVFDKRKNAYAGSSRFYDIQLSNSCLQLGFTWYGKQFQGTGINVNCKYLLLEFAFETMQIDRVEFRADNNNARSIAAMKSIGCTVEGILRSNSFRPDGSRRDSIVLSILKSEWKGSVKDRLQAKVKAAKKL